MYCDKRFVIILFLASLQPLGCHAGYLNEADAASYLLQKINKTKVYDWTTPKCLSFYTEDTTKQYFDISIHELHNDDCYGDPNTHPVIDRFRVYRAGDKSHNTLWHNMAIDRYLPFKKFVESRKNKLQK